MMPAKKSFFVLLFVMMCSGLLSAQGLAVSQGAKRLGAKAARQAAALEGAE